MICMTARKIVYIPEILIILMFLFFKSVTLSMIKAALRILFLSVYPIMDYI